jgi:tRNA dimethylallyltransferase
LKYAIHDFTRRQLTWFRRDKRIVWVEGGDVETAEEVVRGFLVEIRPEDREGRQDY